MFKNLFEKWPANSVHSYISPFAFQPEKTIMSNPSKPQSPLPGPRHADGRAGCIVSQANFLPEDFPLPDGEAETEWDDDADESLDPLDDSGLEIDEEPEPDDGDFWIDPDESEDGWN
jgi:hypothetical protein